MRERGEREKEERGRERKREGEREKKLFRFVLMKWNHY